MKFGHGDNGEGKPVIFDAKREGSAVPLLEMGVHPDGAEE